MSNYKFFQHKKCEYFPCHKIKNIEDFNCLFCYYPLYFVDECGGNYTVLKTDNGRIKDCSNCNIPHHIDNYDYMVGQIMKHMYKKGVNNNRS